MPLGEYEQILIFHNGYSIQPPNFGFTCPAASTQDSAGKGFSPPPQLGCSGAEAGSGAVIWHNLMPLPSYQKVMPPAEENLPGVEQ